MDSVPTVWTVGHSTRTLEQFLTLLAAHRISTVADVRSVPRSRRHPQFNRETLPGALAAAGVGYVHLAALGGRRRPRRTSLNTAWRNVSFRGYADHVQTAEFEAGLAALMRVATGGRVAVLCAEAVPWRCHRSLIADALTARGAPVLHIVSVDDARPHALTPFAHVDGGRVTYPGDQGTLPLDTD